MRYQVLSPLSSNRIDPSVDFFIVHDHTVWKMIESNFLKKKVIPDLFASQGLDFRDYFFILDTYLNFDNFEYNGYFYPNFLLKTAVDYQNFSPDHVIDFRKKTHSVNCAMNKMRPARVLASCWFANNTVNQMLYTQSWISTDAIAMRLLDELLQMGGLIDWTYEFGPDVRMLEQRWIESEMIVLNCTESKISFSPYYRNEENFFNSEVNQLFDSTAISVVVEPVFWEHGSIACEKYMHAIYGGTIPLVSGYKIYDSLRTLGFDTFSDIIDTSSQYELNPILRVWNMLEKNKRLFLQWQELISDPHIQNRILKNLTLLQNPEQIFMNSLKLNSEQSLNKILSFKDSLSTCGFQYVDRLCITDKTNK